MTVRILSGHVLDRLRDLPDESVHCVVTSPPYYGLRDYGIEPQVWGGDPNCHHDFDVETVAGEIGKGNWAQGTNGRGELQPGGVDAKREPIHSTTERGFCRHCNAWSGSLGLEPTLDLYLDHTTEVLRAVRRVLRKDGTVFLNIGDSYCNADKWGRGGANTGKHTRAPDGTVASWTAVRRKWSNSGFKPKDLMLIPSRLAIRLQDDGWWVRSDIAWCKRAPMPESCTDRPTTAWEHVFLLTKSAKYFWDQEAVKEEVTGNAHERGEGNNPKRKRGIPGVMRSNPTFTANELASSRNMRSFWLLGPSPYPDAHFATFPPEIPRRAILAGTSERGVCPMCGAPWARIVKKPMPPKEVFTKRRAPDDKLVHSGYCMDGEYHGNGRKLQNWLNEHPAQTIGWHPTCGCLPPETETPGVLADGRFMPIPATVLDPFLGAGTTGLVADQLQRNCIGIELSPKYAEMARQRITEDNSLFSEIAVD